MTLDQPRVSVLHPDVGRRGMFGQPRTVWVPWLVVLLFGGLFYMSHQTVPTLLGVVVVLLGFAGVTYQFEGAPSLGARGVAGYRERARRRHGEHVFWPESDADAFAAGEPCHGYYPASDPGWVRPVPLGEVVPLKLAHTPFPDLFVLHHSNPGETEYLSVLIEVEGLRGGLRSNAAYAASQAAYGRVLAQLAKKASHIRGFEELHRSVPYDVRQHVFWYTDNLMTGATDTLLPVVLSYDQLVDQVKAVSEEHRSFVTIRIPVTSRFLSDAKDRGPFPVSWASIVNDELERVEGLLRGAGLGQVKVLGESRACAVFRAFQDPSFPIDKHAGVTWENCWQHYVGFEDYVKVNDWFTAVAEVDGVEPAELGPLWLSPLLTGVEPDRAETAGNAATVRTVKVRVDLVPAARARARARSDRTSDVAAQIEEHEKGVITDGTSNVMLSGSAHRAIDLVPGSGHHGIVYSMMVSVSARNEDALRRAKSRVEDAAAECAIPDVRWARWRHDVSVFSTYPLGRGMAETKDSVRTGR